MSSTTNNNKMATYKWVIANFSRNHKQNSPRFGFHTSDSILNGFKFHLYINPSFDINYWGGTYVSISIYLCSFTKDDLKVKYRLWIVNAKGEKCNTLEGTETFKAVDYNALYNIRRSVIMDSALGMLVNDTLTVVCEIELANDGKDLPVKLDNFNAISKQYQDLLESSKHSDVVLSCGAKEFRAHKLVLSTRSPVFAAMFDHSNTKEAQEGRVNIVDIPMEVFEPFLRYLYTGRIESLDRFAPELLAAADMYQIDCLKSLCERFLAANLFINSVAQLLIHADLYRAEMLKGKCLDYIADNSEKVKATKGWKMLSKKNDLLVTLFDKLSIKLNSASK